jgi:hypothetical protein
MSVFSLTRTFSVVPDEPRDKDTVPDDNKDCVESFADTVRERNITCFHIESEELTELMLKIERFSDAVDALDALSVSANVLHYFRKECDKCETHLPDADCRGEETPGHFLSDYIQDIIRDLIVYYKNCDDEHIKNELKDILKSLYVVMYGYFMKDYSLSFSDEVIQMSAKRVATMVSSGELLVDNAPRFVDKDINILREIKRDE